MAMPRVLPLRHGYDDVGGYVLCSPVAEFFVRLLQPASVHGDCPTNNDSQNWTSIGGAAANHDLRLLRIICVM